MPNVSVILPAAGSGARFGASSNKIFQTIRGRAIFLRSIDLFAARDDVVQILLVVSPNDAAEISGQFAGELDTLGVEVVTGGPQRSDSVRNALAHLDDAVKFVCVHDAVRPCVTPEQIDEVFHTAFESGAAILACPLHGTIKKVAPSGEIITTVDREGLWEAQTPQVFGRGLLVEAYELSGQATDDAQMVEQTGAKITVVPSDPNNIKITTQSDLAFAEMVIQQPPGC
jgi:2-C-methyl-D-erythritol 4-phosphate cytidylyltransferase